METEGAARMPQNQSWQKQFHVGQANITRHMRMGGNDNACLHETATTQNIYALIVLCVGESKAPPVLYPSYSTVYVEARAIQHGT